MTELERATETVVGPCLRVQPGEDVVIVVDTTTQAIGEALRAAAAAAGGEPVVCVMEPRSVDGEEPPAAVAAALAAAEAHVTCPRGSDFRVDLTGRTGISDDGTLQAPGAFGNLPCGEGFIAPLSGEGTLYAATLASVGLPDEPVRLTVEDGRLADASGEWGARWTGLLDAA